VSKSFEEADPGSQGFGERLRREREMRGISLDEIAATTKIGTRLLRALEDEQFELLPGGIFNKNYVRAYARHLGINEEQAVADYLRAAHEAPPDVRLIAHQNSAMHGRYNGDRNFGRPGFPIVPMFTLLVVIAGAAGGWRLYQQRQRERAQPVQPLVATQTTALNSSSGSVASGPEAATSPMNKAATSQPTASSADSNVVGTVEAAEKSSHSNSKAESEPSPQDLNAGAQTPAPFAVTVRAKDRARVEVKSDGEVVVRGVIEPSEVRTFHATNRLVFWTADASQVEISFNGKSVPLSGGENDERVLIFNSHGLVPRMAAQ
jgi:cytoskeleton protein RodZ